MDVLDIFLKKYSYKFPKGYPDMNNEQDILLMESILSELGINLDEVNGLQASQLNKRGNLDKFLDMFYNQELFDTDNGKVILDKITIKSDSFDIQDKDKKDILKNIILLGKPTIYVLGKYVDTGDLFKDTTGKLHKTEDFGGKTSAPGEGIEAKELAYVNDLIEQNGGKIDIVLDDTVYPNITKAIKVPKNKQADFEFIGDNNLYIQHKDMVSQQLSGVHKLNLLDVEELTDDELTIVVKKYPEIQEFVKDVKALRPDGLVSKDNISRIISPKLQMEAAYGIGNEFGPSKVQAVFFGNLTLEPEQLDNEKTIFRLSSPAHFVFPTPLSKEYEVMITATFRNKMNQQGVKNARFGFYPKKVYPKTQMI